DARHSATSGASARIASRYPAMRPDFCIASLPSMGGRLSHGQDDGGKIEYLKQWMSHIHPRSRGMRKLPPLASLRAVEAAARRLSFHEAAAELGVTPTAISHQIRILEDVCGKPLFRRRPRPLALTEAGQRLFPVIRHGFDCFAAAIASASARGDF